MIWFWVPWTIFCGLLLVWALKDLHNAKKKIQQAFDTAISDYRRQAAELYWYALQYSHNQKLMDYYLAYKAHVEGVIAILESGRWPTEEEMKYVAHP